jgi:hypothetical protein
MLRATLLATAVGCTAAFTALPARSVTHRASRANVMRATDNLESPVSCKKRRIDGDAGEDQDGDAHDRWLYSATQGRRPITAAKMSMGFAFVGMFGGFAIIFYTQGLGFPEIAAASFFNLAWGCQSTYDMTRELLSADTIEELRELGFHPRPLSFDGFATNYLRALLAPDMLKEGR